MKVSLQFKDDGITPGILHCEAIVEFDLKMEDSLKVLRKLQESNIPGAIAKVLSGKESVEKEVQK